MEILIRKYIYYGIKQNCIYRFWHNWLYRQGYHEFYFDLFVATTRKYRQNNKPLIVNDTLSKTNIRRLKEDISYILNIYYDIPLKRLNLGELLKETMNIVYKQNKTSITITFY